MAEHPADPAPAEVEPLPVEPLLVEPVPVEPVPVEPLDDEPIESVSSIYPVRRLGPPGAVMTLGVCSIVVAGLGLLGGPATALVIAGYSAALTAPAVRPIAPVPAVASPPGAAEVLDPDGLPTADRLAVARGLSRVRPITPAQALQLDELLAESGRQVIGAGGSTDPAVVAAGVSVSGKLESLGTAAGENDGTPSYFLMPNGRLELTDGRAVFFPGDGQPAVRAVAYALPETPPGDDAPPLLSDDTIRSTLRNVARMNGERLRSTQVRAIVGLLRGPAEQIVVPTIDGSDPAAEVTAASSDPDGILVVQTVHGATACDLRVTSGGQVSASLSAVAAPTSVAAPPLNTAALGTVVILATVQFAAALYLLVAGILTVRQSRSGGLLHWIYVGIKVPTGIAAAGATAYLITSLRGMGGNGIVPWLVPPALGLTYALAVAVLLARRSARDYYRRT